ncbi:MAG: alpha-L-fucosidase [Maribacter sp.]|uniref:alpha-L-fucosidase n=1 Tax=Maribacter sp. TaxID=1897614 RepID=UPI00329725C1
MRKSSVYFFLFIVMVSCQQAEPPNAIGPVPTERHLAWHELQYYAFIHFNMNTFTDMEWGTGGEKPAQFNPTELDARQWARVAKEAGMKGIIITAKHHDGFCLWPTKTTEHSVKNSPWKNGKGDLLKDLSEACKAFGLKFGIYLSPWDRNHKDYGKPKYVEDFHEQLRELLSNYGEIFEVWFDGANGGSGYYGGANETRKIDNKTYYQWDKTTEIVRELQPKAVIFSDGGPDIRWVGTEEGWANETNWSVMRRDEIYPGWPRYVELRSGHEDGTHWLPAEVNTSIRPGWYYHPREDHQVKTLPRLVQTYYESIGRNGNFLLNLPVDTRGLVHENDKKQLLALKKQIDADFETELGKGLKVTASDERDPSRTYSASKVNDGANDTYWATKEGVTTATLTFEFDTPTEVNRIVLQEYIPLGQRVQSFSIEAEINGRWSALDMQTTIGYKRILRFETISASQIRINFLASKGPLAISNIELYRAPNFLVEPKMKRNKEGLVTLSVPDETVEIFYTTDGSQPSPTSQRYTTPFLVKDPTTLKMVSFDSLSGKQTESVSRDIDIPKRDWKVIEVSTGEIETADFMIDENPDTFWSTNKNRSTPQEVVIDLGSRYNLKGFTYWPIQERYPFGIITKYEFSVSTNARNWKSVSKGEFANIVNSRLQQKVAFPTTKARYIKLRALQVDGKDMQASFAEIGVITE